MKRVLNYFRGSVRVTVDSPYPERLVNICAQNDIEFWDLTRISPTTVHITMHIGGFRTLQSLTDKAGFSIDEIKKTGLPFLLWQLRKRTVLLSGLFVMFVAVWSLTLFVWEIDVYGNEDISAQQILASLDELGVGIGSFGPSIVSEAISNDMILKLPELAWIAINVSGSHADVLVRERIPTPELRDEREPVMVYAVKAGIITEMSVLEGAAVCRAGDTVASGDILVTGIMDSIANGNRMVHAMGDVTARTWYDISAQMVLPTMQKAYTGAQQTKRALVIAGNRINLYYNGGISFVWYDKIITEKILKLPTGNVLPLSLVTEKYSEYEPTDAKLTIPAAEAILEQRLLDRLANIIGDGEIVTTVFDTTLQNGIITVTLSAECLEQIASERPFTAEELFEATLPDMEKTDETEN